MNQSVSIRSMAEVLGACGSTLCALHCLLVPLVLVSGTALPISVLGGESFHRGMLWLVLPAGVVAFSLGCRRHKDRFVVLLGVAGIGGLLLSAVWLHDILGEAGESAATVLSAAVLVAAHIRNWWLCRGDDCGHDCDRG